jgi:predicted lipase
MFIIDDMNYPFIFFINFNTTDKKKEVNQGQHEQIRALIIHVIISDSTRTHILNEQSSRDRNLWLVIFESNT